jgi:hypothetical protein
LLSVPTGLSFMWFKSELILVRPLRPPSFATVGLFFGRIPVVDPALLIPLLRLFID